MQVLNFLMALSPIIVVLVGILVFRQSAKKVAPVALVWTNRTKVIAAILPNNSRFAPDLALRKADRAAYRTALQAPFAAHGKACGYVKRCYLPTK